MYEEKNNWSEENSRAFIDKGKYYVPDRQEQIDLICDLVPDAGGPFRILELACGPGLLAEALLERIPNCTVHGLDGSEVMLQAASERLQAFGSRFQPGRFDLVEKSWRETGAVYQAVVSSLAIHHLDGEGKAALFRDVHRMLLPGGAFLIADILRPAGPTGAAYAAKAYDEVVRRQSLAIDGNLDVFEQFQQDRWNLFRYPDDPIDQPSTLYEQLRWLEQAGFDHIDVFWLKAGHAVFGGVR